MIHATEINRRAIAALPLARAVPRAEAAAEELGSSAVPCGVEAPRRHQGIPPFGTQTPQRGCAKAGEGSAGQPPTKRQSAGLCEQRHHACAPLEGRAQRALHEPCHQGPVLGSAPCCLLPSPSQSQASAGELLLVPGLQTPLCCVTTASALPGQSPAGGSHVRIKLQVTQRWRCPRGGCKARAEPPPQKEGE